jgi:ribosomal protein S18 acetylase RimI-like enzyme
MATVRKAQPSDSRAIARLHREIISWALLTQLGEDVVTAFYRAVTQSSVAFCFVAEDQGTLAGFAAGVCDWPRLRREVMAQAWRPLLMVLPSLLWSGRWRKIWETGRYTQSGHEGVNAEFLSFGVRESVQGRVWAGAALAYAVMEEFRRRGVARIRGVVWDQNERAIRFFQGVGFRFVSEFEIHPGERSRTFVMDLAPRRQEARP